MKYFGGLIKTVNSMTGFGHAKKNENGFEITVEIKSVNHRFFEYSSRLPRAYQFLDDGLKNLFRQRISRGKVEVSVTIEDLSECSIEMSVNHAYADAYISALRSFAKEYRIKDDLKLSSLVSAQELFVLKKREIDEKLLTEAVISTASIALDAFINMRASEGKRLVDDVKDRAELILNKVSSIEIRSPETVKEYSKRLEEKIKELVGDVHIDEQRLLTEVAIFADKVAVCEETVRLRSHITALESLLTEGGAIGRKLDFIVQEMNREANTIGSKAQDTEILKNVVDIKSEIEKIREQIQNIE